MKPRILVIDDSAAMRRLIRTALEGKGHVVVEAVSGREALAVLQATTGDPADLIITDLYMPGLDGLSLVRLIRRLEAHRLTPILVLTAECSDVMQRRGRAAGATAWLLKPFYGDQLCRAVSHALDAALPSRDGPLTLGRSRSV